MRNTLSLVSAMLIVALVGGCTATGESSASTSVSVTVQDTQTSTTALAEPITTRDASAVTTTSEAVGTSSTADQAETTATDAASSGSVELELSFFDWTETNPPSEEAFVVVEDVGSWTPDLEFGGDDHTFGHFQIGVPGTLLIYPDGTGGEEISVSFVMTDEMISGSAQALTHVEIYDSEVLVYGQAIPNFEQTFNR